MIIQVNRVGNKLSGSNNGVPFSVSYSDEKFSEMKRIADQANAANSVEAIKFFVSEFSALTRESYADYVETASPYIKVNKDTGRFYIQYNGVISDQHMPEKLAKKIINAVERSFDITPLVKCWVRFLHCPNYTYNKASLFVDYMSTTYTDEKQVTGLMAQNGLSEVMAIEFSTTNQVAITMEGMLVGYKASREISGRDEEMKLLPRGMTLIDNKPIVIDEQTGLVVYDDTKYDEYRIFEPPQQAQNGDSFYCGNYLGHIMKVGHPIFLPHWHQVNCSDGISGVEGLHVGGLKYIKGYQGRGTMTHNIIINPEHIGAIVGLGNGDDGAMRVKQYFMLNAFKGVNKSLYHSSTYNKVSDEQYEQMIEEAAKKRFLEL